MKKLFILFFLVGCLPSSPAIDLKEAKFTQVVNQVDVVSTTEHSHHQAAIDDMFKMPDLLRTGEASRAELVAADNTITRVGANTIFSYDKANRTLDLRQGSLLFHSPTGKGGGTIHTSAAVAAVIGTTIIVSTTPDGGFKVLDLEGEVEVRFANGRHLFLESGQMTFVLPGGRQAPVIVFRLDQQTKDSLLVQGFDHPLPSLAKINAAISKQLVQILNHRAADTGLLVGNSASPSGVQAVLDTVDTVALIARLRQSPVLNNINISSAAVSLNTSVGDISVGGSSLNATVGDTTLNAGGNLDVGNSSITAAANVSLTGININVRGTLLQGPAITLNASSGILIDTATLTGNNLNLAGGKGNLLGGPAADVQNTDLTTFATVNMAAHTVNLMNVAFSGTSTVNLQSFFGLLAPLPNSGATSLPGFVNFINGVTYGGSPAQNFVTATPGPGIHISAMP